MLYFLIPGYFSYGDRAMVDNTTSSIPATIEGNNPGNTVPDNLTKRTRQRSAYLFPAYDFSTALDIAQRVEENGNGSLSEETLAVNMGLSAKSSGFKLKTLTARQFQLLTKQGETLITTPTAKAILKPTSEDDALNGYRQSFMAIPLFRAVAERFKGQFLPDSPTMRNVLEREFQVDHERVQHAERTLLDSARDAHVTTQNGDKKYLTVSGQVPAVQGTVIQNPQFYVVDQPPFDSQEGDFKAPPVEPPHREIGSAPNTLTFSLDEIGQLGDDDFDTVWAAMGTLVKARRSRQQQQLSYVEYEKIDDRPEDLEVE